MRRYLFVLICFVLLLLGAAFLWAYFSDNTELSNPQAPKREVRAVWIATAYNRDYPSQRGLPNKWLLHEMHETLDQLQRQGINTVFLQVRVAADALYPSRVEPWTEWLTGIPGEPPMPFFDPLAAWVKACHERNMEIHAWFNPFRASLGNPTGMMVENHVTRLYPRWIVTHGKHQYLDPGLPEVRRYVTLILLDVALRYDVDGIHFDDYFYPVETAQHPFPDDSSFALYKGNFEDRKAWRRDNLNQFVEGIHIKLKQMRPYLKFGISPTAVWRHKGQDPLGSDTHGRITAYDHQFADIRHWLEQGWLDYVAPQLYLSAHNTNADYRTLLDWWSRHTYGRHLYVGMGYYKLRDADPEKQWPKEELIEQMMLNRQTPGVLGQVFFGSSDVLANPHNATTAIRQQYYRLPALIPPMPWKDNIPPNPPQALGLIEFPTQVRISWKPPLLASDREPARYYAVYRFPQNTAQDIKDMRYLLAIQQDTVFLDKTPAQTRKVYTYCVTALDRLHNESLPVKITN